MSDPGLRDEIERRVFVVGVPRSGTTLVQSLLAAHGALTSFTESHLFDRHFRLLPGTSRALMIHDPGPRLREFLAENGERPPEAAGWFARPGGWRPGSRALWPLHTRSAARRLLRVLDELALRRGASGWVEKTPRHLRYLPFLERLCGGSPRPRFVHVIRDGLEAVASLRRASQAWERSYDLESCVRRWNEDVAFSAGRLGRPGDHFVIYEELAARPEPVLRELLAALGLEWEPEILERYGDAAGRLVTEEEAWKTGVGRAIRPSTTAQRTLSDAERRRVVGTLRRQPYERLRAHVARAAAAGGSDA